MDRRSLRSEKGAGSHYFVLSMVVTLMTINPNPCNADTIDQLKAAREEYIDGYRVHGKLDAEKAKAIENRLKTLEKSSEGKLLARIVFELATIQRITNQFETAIGTYERAAVAAKKNRDTDTGFEAWLGIARSHAYGTRNHGAAAAAFEQAAAAAGNAPTRKQRYQMAGYLSQLQAGRGELEAALLNALEAVNLAQDNLERFYAFRDTADVLRNFAESCDYRKIVDAKTNSENDTWGACKRAVAAARSYYEKAGITANKLGWAFLEKESQQSAKWLDMRVFIINQKANSEPLGQAGVFNAENVLVNEHFSSGGSELAEGIPLGPLIEHVVPEVQANDPRSIYLRGVKADLDGNPGQALDYFKKAANLLAMERASLFDLRQSGTVVENRPELIRDLGLRLLKFKRFDEAFVVFESLRSHGLQSLSTAFDKNKFTDAERKWIAGLVQLDSFIGAKQNLLVETAIAGIEDSHSLELLDELNHLKQQRQERQKEKQFQSVLKRLKSAESEIPTMTQLKEIVDKAGIPVLLYWVTPTNVVVWVVSPKGAEVKTVFLPEAAVVDKVSKLRESSKTAGRAFDDKAAKELHAYLIKPFAHYLNRDQVVIIPQGPLVGLPFEALVDAENGEFLAEKMAVSYAPNAAFIMRALKGRLPEISNITALYDEKIEKRTHEIEHMKGIEGVLVSSHSSKGMNAEKTIKLLGDAKTVHVLLHGKYNYDDPLQSTVKISEGRNLQGEYLTAAELLAADWRDKQLAVFSSCEGALVKTRISNEQFGISWALLAGGADQVILSRWLVNEASNAVWMETCYKSLLVEKVSPALAANVARRKMIKSDMRHPYYWAGPQVFGR